jgi:hypothetical protein
VGDPVQFKSSGEKLEVCDSAGYPVAVLSKSAMEKWAAVHDHIENTRVIAMVERRADDSKDIAYKKLLKVDSWEVPVLEVVWDCKFQLKGDTVVCKIIDNCGLK